MHKPTHLQDNDLFIIGRYAGESVMSVARKDPAYIETCVASLAHTFSPEVMYAISEEGIAEVTVK